MIMVLQIAGGIVLAALVLFAMGTAPEQYRRWRERRAFNARFRH